MTKTKFCEQLLQTLYEQVIHPAPYLSIQIWQTWFNIYLSRVQSQLLFKSIKLLSQFKQFELLQEMQYSLYKLEQNEHIALVIMALFAAH